MANFFTSDLHHRHTNIIQMSNRPFDNIEHMDDTLIDNINKKVLAQDTLWILGDYCMNQDSWTHSKLLRERLNCKTINLITGNHDWKRHNEFKELKYPKEIFNEIHKLYEGKIEGQFMVLCHYAMKTWAGQGLGAIHAFGHSHFNLEDDEGLLSLDVGVDGYYEGVHERFFPYHLDEINQLMKRKTPKKVDHH